jgi:hypothetical protein
MTEPSDVPNEIGVETAWRLHEALSTWTGRVDTKASIVLTLEVTALGFVTALTDSNRMFSSVSGWQEVVFRISFVLLGWGILFAVAAVIPQLGGRAAKERWKSGFIYFGHLRRWDPKALERKLSGLRDTDLRQALSLQLVVMSKIAWRKHRWLQVAVASGVAAGLGFVIVGAA